MDVIFNMLEPSVADVLYEVLDIQNQSTYLTTASDVVLSQKEWNAFVSFANKRNLAPIVFDKNSTRSGKAYFAGVPITCPEILNQ